MTRYATRFAAAIAAVVLTLATMHQVVTVPPSFTAPAPATILA